MYFHLDENHPLSTTNPYGATKLMIENILRDYIHVVDLANAHLKALESLKTPQCEAINIGTGNGYSVVEVIKAFEKASGKKVKYKITQRRDGDIASCYANSNKAKEILNWEAKFDINKMCEDNWNWQIENPRGYKW